MPNKPHAGAYTRVQNIAAASLGEAFLMGVDIVSEAGGSHQIVLKDGVTEVFKINVTGAESKSVNFGPVGVYFDDLGWAYGGSPNPINYNVNVWYRKA